MSGDIYTRKARMISELYNALEFDAEEGVLDIVGEETEEQPCSINISMLVECVSYQMGHGEWYSNHDQVIWELAEQCAHEWNKEATLVGLSGHTD